MQSLASDIEQSARAGSLEDAGARFDEFCAECNSVRDALSVEQRRD